MLKKIFKLVKKVIFSSFLLYGYNILVTPLNVIVPINLITIFTITLFGFPALLGFIGIYVILF